MKKYQIMLVGCGGMGHAWADYVLQTRQDCEIIALVDLLPEHAQGYRDHYGLTCPIYDHIDKAFAVEKPNLVIDTTTPDAHHEIRTKALLRRIPVIGEKPLADSMANGLDIVRTADAQNTRHAVMQNRRWIGAMRKMHDLAHDERLGPVGFLLSQFYIEAHFGGFRDLMDYPLILDMAVHTFDQARMILGCDPVSVFCHEFNLPGSWYRGNASAVCVYEFENGAVYTYTGSWSSKGFNTSWEADWRMICQNGTVLCDGNHAPVVQIGSEKTTEDFVYTQKTGHPGCFDEMFAALEEDRAAETDCHDNIKTLGMVFGAIESAETGLKVSLR